MLIRRKRQEDESTCVDLLLRVHESDGYPRHLPKDVPAFVTPEYEAAAWVAVRDDRIVGHVALHEASVDPTLAVAQRFTGLPADRLAVISRLFTEPALRREGIGRGLLRQAMRQAHSRGQRAVLDVVQSLAPPIGLYESERWTRAGSLALRVESGDVLDLWVYVSPA